MYAFMLIELLIGPSAQNIQDLPGNVTDRPSAPLVTDANAIVMTNITIGFYVKSLYHKTWFKRRSFKSHFSNSEICECVLPLQRLSANGVTLQPKISISIAMQFQGTMHASHCTPQCAESQHNTVLIAMFAVVSLCIPCSCSLELVGGRAAAAGANSHTETERCQHHQAIRASHRAAHSC
jgi:hypothetical protein